LLDAQFLARGFVRFLRELTSARRQWERFRAHVEAIERSDNFVSPAGRDTTAPWRRVARFVRLQLVHRAGRATLWARTAYVLENPTRWVALVRAWLLARSARSRGRDVSLHLQIWVYLWTSLGLRYRGLHETDFALHSVDAGFDRRSLLEESISHVDVSADRLARADAKSLLQTKHTRAALRRLVVETAADTDPTSENPRALASG
jgi:hypothetical protein